MRFALALLLALPASAQPLDDVPLADILEVLLIDRELVAIDAQGGGQTTLSLRLAEQVAWHAARGAIGVALTDQRILAVAVGSAAWQSENRLRDEVLPERALLGDRVALLATSRRLFGFDGGSGNLVQSALGLRENLLSQRVGENVGVVVTDRRALGLSPVAGGFFPIEINLDERLESVSASANVATVTTSRRVLIFRSPSGTWEIRLRTLN